MAFYLHRDSYGVIDNNNKDLCHTSQGIFHQLKAEEEIALANSTAGTKATRTAWQNLEISCSDLSGIENGLSKESGKLLVEIDEGSAGVWSFTTEIELAPHENEFTFCSIYPCPRTECALPEQMVRGRFLF